MLDDVGTAGLLAGVAAFDAGDGREAAVLFPLTESVDDDADVVTGGTGTFTGGT